MVDTVFTAGQRHAQHLRHAAIRERASLLHAVRQAAEAAAGQDPPPEALLAYVTAQQRLQEHHHRATRLAAARAGVIERDFAEAPTFHFHATHGRGAPEDRLIRSIAAPGPSPDSPPRTITLSDHDGRSDAAEAIAAFYSSDSPGGLFRPGDVDAAAQAHMLAALDSRLSDGHRLSCEGLFSPEELHAALGTLPRGKSPGSDGLPYELYTALWDVLGQPMCDAFNEAFIEGDSGEPSLTRRQRTGTIVMLYKGGRQDRAQLASYRPITLFNTDVKIAGKAMALRMARPLTTVVDITQTAFLPDRWIGDNLLSHLEEVDYAAATDTPGAVVLLDYAKAFDRLHRGWLAACMAALGFGPDAQRWVSVFLAGSMASVSFNGWFTGTFPTAGGVGQGSPLSPLLYVLAAQPLAAQARRLQRLGLFASILQPDGRPAPPTHQHADDTSLHARTPADAAIIFREAVLPFCAASGARINVSKTHGLLIGSAAAQPPFLDAATGIQYSSQPQRHLGLPIGSDTADALVALQRAKLASIAHTIALWSRHSLTFLGRVYVARQCLASKLAFVFTFIPPDPAVYRDIQATIFGYVKTGRLLAADHRHLGAATHPSRLVSALPLGDGGVRLPDLSNAPVSLRLKYVTRLLEPTFHPWKAFATQWFGRDAAWFTAHPTAQRRPIDRWGLATAALVSTFPITTTAGIPRRVAAAVQAFQRLRPHRLTNPDSLDSAQVACEPLFYNRRITDAAGMPLGGAAWHAVADAGVRRVADLSRSIGAAGPLDLQLRTLAAALPPSWRRLLPGPAVPPPPPPALPAALLSPGASQVAILPPAAAPAAAAALYFVAADRSLVPAALAPPAAAALRSWAPCRLLRWDASRPWRRQLPADGSAADAGCWYLVGAAAAVSLDPSAWGCGSTPLHQLTARLAAQRLRVIQLREDCGPEYLVGQPLRPRVWEDDWSAADPDRGIRHVEARWAEHHRERQEAAVVRRRALSQASAEASAASWMRPSPSRRHPRDRARDRSPPPAPQLEPPHRRRLPLHPPDDAVDLAARQLPAPPWRGVWLAVQDRRLPRDHREVAWRVLHAALPCAAFRARYGAADSPACPRPACGASPADLTHTFVTCELAASVVGWICDVWAAIEPLNRPPPTFAVIAAGDDRQWRPGHAALWLRLRLRLLYELWVTSAAGASASAVPPSAVAVRIVAGAAAEMRLDWLRACMPAEVLADACGTWMTGAGPRLTPEAARAQFADTWCAAGQLCRLPADAGANVPDIRWSAVWPVPFPGRPPDPARGA